MKSQVFTSSILIMSMLFILMVFQYNNYMLNSFNSLSNYLSADELITLSHNFIETSRKIANQYYEIEINQNTVNVTNYFYANSNYNPQILLQEYNSLLFSKKQGINTNYSFSGLEEDLANEFSEQIISYYANIYNFFDQNIIEYSSISYANSINILVDGNSSVESYTTCTNGAGIPIHIFANNMDYSFKLSGNCQINIVLQNSTSTDSLVILLNDVSDTFQIDYSGINEINDVNIEIEINYPYDNLFKISSPYSNTKISLSKDEFFLTKSMSD